MSLKSLILKCVKNIASLGEGRGIGKRETGAVHVEQDGISYVKSVTAAMLIAITVVEGKVNVLQLDSYAAQHSSFLYFDLRQDFCCNDYGDRKMLFKTHNTQTVRL